MTIDWDDVRIFQSAVRAGGYSTAARTLDLDRTTVGRRVARLEQSVGCALWEHTAAGYRPTEAGRAVLRAAVGMERAMARFGSHIAHADDAVTGTVRIAGTAGIAALLVPAMAVFMSGYPAVSLEIVGAHNAIAAVQQRKADLGFAIASTMPHDIAGLRIAAFEQGRYGRNGVSPGRVVAWGQATMLANPQPWARLNAPAPEQVAMEVDGIAAMHEAVRAGIGTAWLWTALGDTDVALDRFDGSAPAAARAALWIVRRRDLAVAPAAAALFDAAETIVAAFVAASARLPG